MSRKLDISINSSVKELDKLVEDTTYFGSEMYGRIVEILVKAQKESYDVGRRDGYDFGGEVAIDMVGINENWDNNWFDFYQTEWKKRI